MTLLLNGQAVKVGLASTSVTVMRGSMRLRKRAQVAPAKPPPTTTTRPPAPWPIAGIGSIGRRRRGLPRSSEESSTAGSLPSLTSRVC